jgi:polyphenol oxidase
MSSFPKVVHGFSLRGVADFDFSPKAPRRNWELLDQELGGGWDFALASQVHGDRALWTANAGLAGEGDALLTARPGLVLCIRTADCVPILVVADSGVAAIHAGWRGLACGVISAAVSQLRKPTFAVVGPCIGQTAYEVGEEVVEGLCRRGTPRSVFVDDRGEKPHADLAAAACWQLQAEGVLDVENLSLCTYEDPRFHSYRRDRGESGRMLSFIGIKC